MALLSAERSDTDSLSSTNEASTNEVNSTGSIPIGTSLVEAAGVQSPPTAAYKSLGSKAHAATVRRLAERYAVQPGVECDLLGSDWVIEVETAATLAAGIQKLLHKTGRRFVAMTNRESIQDALELTKATEIGVMSPKGDIVKEAGRGSEAAA